MNKTTKTIIITVLVMLVLGALTIFSIKEISEKKVEREIEIYNQGVNDALIQIAQQQVETGNIFVINNNTVTQVNIKDVCGQ